MVGQRDGIARQAMAVGMVSPVVVESRYVVEAAAGIPAARHWVVAPVG